MIVDPLGDLQVSVDALNLEETNPMKAVMMHLTSKISIMTVEQINIKEQNNILMASARKFQIEDTVRQAFKSNEHSLSSSSGPGHVECVQA